VGKSALVLYFAIGVFLKEKLPVISTSCYLLFESTQTGFLSD